MQLIETNGGESTVELSKPDSKCLNDALSLMRRASKSITEKVAREAATKAFEGLGDFLGKIEHDDAPGATLPPTPAAS